MHDPHLHIEPTECDAGPLPGSSALSAGTLTLVILAIMGWSVVAGLIWLAYRVINAILSVQWPV
jgi:hypothetical protein